MEALAHASIFAKVSLIVVIVPLGAGMAYVIRPTEQRLALLRPLALAGLFAGLSSGLLGMVNVLRMIGVSSTPVDSKILAIGIAEALVPPFIAFACLTAAWLCVAVGLRRHV
jgi:biopolymer transport protein ExbB/TolQ